MSTDGRFGRAGLAAFLAVVAAAITVVVVTGDNDPGDRAAPAATTEPQVTTLVTELGDQVAGASTVAAADTTPAGRQPAPPATTTTTVPRPRTTAEATPEDPVPPGEVIEFTGVWDIAVTDVDLDATDYIIGLNNINPTPEPGYQYVLISIAGTYLGERTAEPVFEWTVSDGTNTYAPSVPGCGVIPDSIYDIVEIVPGDSFQGAICVPVLTEGMANGLELTLQLVGDDPKYFSLD